MSTGVACTGWKRQAGFHFAKKKIECVLLPSEEIYAHNAFNKYIKKHESTAKGSKTSSDADKMTAKTQKKITVTKRQHNGTGAK